LLALHVTAANEQDRAQVEELAKQVQQITGDTVELAYVDQGFSETVSGLTGGNVSYTTTYHSPDGQIVTPAASINAPSYVTFHRRWIIEANQPVAGTRRVTVLVTLMDSTVKPSVNFQMSLVRP
jgi:hypothetical protein